jgi:predicted enzyme related to lactoylglutathione lyase
MALQNPKTNLGHPSVLLSTSDIDETYSDFKARGIEVGALMNMPYGRMFNFKDQDGNDFIVREDK